MKKSNKSKDAGQTGGYTVGQVSGSLFPEKPKTGALSSLFSTSSSSASTLIFVPAPKAAPNPTPASYKTAVKADQQIPKQTKHPKLISVGEKKLQDRESALQNADEGGQKIKKVKRKRQVPDEEALETNRPIKRRKNMAEERIKLKRTVFVGNLPPSCSKKDLLCLFKEAGPVESVRFRSVFREDPTMSRKMAAIQRKVHPKKQNINAYVVFKDEESAAGALRWNGWEIQKDFHIRVDRVSQHQSHDHKRSIFVGNLPYDINELPLRQHFEECGNVQSVRLVRDRDSGIGKGFGYILFESPDSVVLALKLNGSELLKRKIRVKRSVKKEKVQKVVAGRPSGKKPATGNDRKERGKGNKPSTGGFKGLKKKSKDHTGGRNFMKTQTKASFKGEMTDPTVKKKKGQKKKYNSNNKKKASFI